MEIGQVVVSGAGRDKDSLLVVVELNGATVLVADGKHRPLERLKQKSKKHLKYTGFCLEKNEYRSNKALKAALYRIRQAKMNSERGGI